MFHMKTASVRDLRQNFPRLLAWLEAGDEVAITMRRRAVARLVPYDRRKKPKRPMPDIGLRLKRVFGQKVIPDDAVKAILDYDRGKM